MSRESCVGCSATGCQCAPTTLRSPGLHYVSRTHLEAEKAFYESVVAMLTDDECQQNLVCNPMYSAAIAGLERVTAALDCTLE
jgi:hypothetical protein